MQNRGIKIEINNIEFILINKIEDMTLLEFVNYIKILDEKEYEVKIIELPNGNVKRETIEVIDNSLDFINKKNAAIINELIYTINYDKSFTKEAMELLNSNIVIDNILYYIDIDFSKLDKNIYNSFKFDNVSYFIPEVTSLPTLQYFNYETFINYNSPIEAFSVRVINNETSFKYKESTANQFYNIVCNLSAIKYFNTFIYYTYKEPNDKIRNQFEYVFNKVKPTPSKNTNISSEASINFYNKYGWDAVLIELANSNYWTSPTGNLDAVRNINIIESLSMLNVKKGISFCESEDYIANNK